MASHVRAFYARYYMQTVLMPPYVLALLFYGTAWLLGPASPWAQISGGGVLSVFGVAAVIGLSPLLSGLGFLLSGVPHARINPSTDDLVRLHDALKLSEADSAGLPLAAKLPQAHGSMQPQLVELGPVPYIASGGLDPRQLWISTHTLRNTDPSELRYLVAHEYAHLLDRSRGRGCAWYDLLWVTAYPLSWWLAGISPPLIAAAALLHAMLWLRLSYWIRLRGEYRSDALAVELTDRDGYGRALATFQQQVAAGNRPTALRSRLIRLGFSPEEAEALSGG